MGDRQSNSLPHAIDTSGQALIEPDADESRSCRKEFFIMSATFGLNHATVTTPIIYASSVLTNSAGQAGNALLYGTTLICTLFLSSLLYSILGAKRGLSISMAAYTVYVLLFAVAASMCEVMDANGTCKEGGPFQLLSVLVGAFIGGIGAGLLWTCQGAFFSALCDRIATAEVRDAKEVSAELAGRFAALFLGFECAVRFSTTLLTKYAKLSSASVFYIFAGLAFVATVTFMAFSTDLAIRLPRGSVTDKFLGAIRLWKDPRLWLLQFTNLTFGFAAAWTGGYVGKFILSPALESTGDGASFIGFAGAILSGLAAVLSRVFGVVAQKVGKGPVVLFGSLAFLAIGILSKWVGNPVEWGWGAIIFYLLMGIGRAVYESTNKAIFVDFFPGELAPYAFANVMMFGTGASTAAFILGAVNDIDPELYLLVSFAALTFPCFLAATTLKSHS